ncbi:hypothetical protein [Ochrobactrum sp. CGA5]|uniref:hypothetical protein n=1 Tax=Ochrobactrum sp. CGA5 TaxID=2583453 RepID=UPI00111E9968|nr:hypothetical protein [Ochrobactrum sp. CGA5]
MTLVEGVRLIGDTSESDPIFQACLNQHGMYETMRFVLRLSPVNHALIEKLDDHPIRFADLSPELIEAFSIYLHETVHWWQHVGSTSGLVLSLSYLAQSHSNLNDLKGIIATLGCKKPLKGYTDQILQREGEAAQAKLARANTVVNNALDIEHYKLLALEPREKAEWLQQQTHFEAAGHDYLITYAQVMGLIESVAGVGISLFDEMETIESSLERMKSQKIEGFYHGSPIRLPAVGMKAIYEGQARFIQLQLSHALVSDPPSLASMKDNGSLFGIYLEAFEAFLRLTESEWPDAIDSPTVGLFLLICDLSINPTRGIPLKIESYKDFLLDVDAGSRFTLLCLVVKEMPHLKNAVIDYSRDEYVTIASELTRAAGYDDPIEGISAVINWLKSAPELQQLMEEYRTFEYNPMNVPIRVFVSHFIAFYRDKLAHPEFFCWPGIYLTGQRHQKEAGELWLRHLSLFSDRGDKQGVYPRKRPDKSDEAIMDMFEKFYGNMALYDLTRQWILHDGAFVNDFRWLAENYDQAGVEEWANDTFKQVYGVHLNDFEIVQ